MSAFWARNITAIAILLCASTAGATESQRPNILVIVAEDHSPMVGAYGDKFATTPTLDGLAKKGVTFTNAYSNAPVCAPARNTLITGMYAPSDGGHNHDNGSLQSAAIPFVSRYMKGAGYWTANIGKYHYNLYTPTPMDAWNQKTENTLTWDTTDYKKANKDGHMPFFTLVHYYYSHESQTGLDGWFGEIKDRKRGHTTHDPAKVPVPPYHPDTPAVREDYAQYYDNITRADSEVAKVLKQVKDEGWADDTIVFYFSDHGNGLPRGKRWLYDSGIKVPLIVYAPKKYRHMLPTAPGTKTDQLVGFVDFAPTILSLAGLPIPDYMEGRAYLGPKRGPEPAYVYGHRDRTDERYETIRAVRDKRYKYIRNYMPHLPYAQHLDYVFYSNSTMREWQRLHDQGKLNPVQDAFFASHKPTEELYDTLTDPYETHNLADNPEHRDILIRMRKAQIKWAHDIRDLGLIPEGELQRIAQGRPYYDVTRDDKIYPVDRVIAAAQLAGDRKAENLPQLIALANDPNAIVRYWGAMGILMLGPDGAAAKSQLAKSLDDESPNVRIAAAQALCALGDCDRALEVLISDLTQGQVGARLAAANSLGVLGEKARMVSEKIRAAFADMEAASQIDASGKEFDELFVHENEKALLQFYGAMVKWALKDVIANLDK